MVSDGKLNMLKSEALLNTTDLLRTTRISNKITSGQPKFKVIKNTKNQTVSKKTIKIINRFILDIIWMSNRI
jgi:hypothetical protein